MTPSLAEQKLRSMPVTIAFSDLRNMTEEERSRVIAAALQEPPEAIDNYLLVLDARLREFEHRYELPTSALSGSLASGRLHETADIASWLFWAKLKDNILARKARP